MNYFFGNNVPIVLLLSLVFLANAQRRDVDMQHELERQNKITQQILEAFLQKKLGLRGNVPRAPTILDILPVKMPTPVTTRQPDIFEEDVEDMEDMEDMEQDHEDNMDSQELTDEHELREDDSLQSVESEQIDSIYNTEGRYHGFLFKFGNFLIESTTIISE